MGAVDIAKQAPNVTRMKILGAKVVPVTHGLQSLKEAVDSAFDSYLNSYKDSIYCIGSVVGPHPFPQWCATSRCASAWKPGNSSWK